MLFVIDIFMTICVLWFFFKIYYKKLQIEISPKNIGYPNEFEKSIVHH